MSISMQERTRTKLLQDTKEPIVICNAIRDWPAFHWTPSLLGDLLGDLKLKFRIGSTAESKVLWEADCQYCEATIADFVQWGCRDVQSQEDKTFNPLTKFDHNQTWCYGDYKYMAEVFKGRQDITQAVQWGSFGFKNKDGVDSTFWLGSRGSYTPCHQDTYGCNIVAQIYGRKRWVLFPPENSPFLYPARIPYEESSIFSQVNIKYPDFRQHPNFKKATSYEVTLNAGDVLFVPKHWWHFVECLDTSITVNMWIDLESDGVDRLSESMVRAIVCGLIGESEEKEKWLNPTEKWTSIETNLMYINQSLKSLPEKYVKEIYTEDEPANSEGSNPLKTGINPLKTGIKRSISVRMDGSNGKSAKLEKPMEQFTDKSEVKDKNIDYSMMADQTKFEVKKLDLQIFLGQESSSHGIGLGNIEVLTPSDTESDVGGGKLNDIGFHELINALTSPKVIDAVKKELISKNRAVTKN